MLAVAVKELNVQYIYLQCSNFFLLSGTKRYRYVLRYTTYTIGHTRIQLRNCLCLRYLKYTMCTMYIVYLLIRSDHFRNMNIYHKHKDISCLCMAMLCIFIDSKWLVLAVMCVRVSGCVSIDHVCILEAHLFKIRHHWLHSIVHCACFNHARCMTSAFSFALAKARLIFPLRFSRLPRFLYMSPL